MLNFIKNAFKSRTDDNRKWYKFGTKEGYPIPQTGTRLATESEANRLSGIYAAKDKYKRTITLCPLIVYRTTADGGRERLTTHPAYRVLHDQPNPSHPIATFLELLIEHYFMRGEFCALLRWNNNNSLRGIYPVPAGSLVEVKQTDEWEKVYHIRDDDGQVTEHPAADVIHITKDSADGLRGRSILHFAAQNLGLHATVSDAANSFWTRAARPSLWVERTAPIAPGAAETEERMFKEKFCGPQNSGEIPFLSNAKVNAFPGLTAEESQLLEALNASLPDVARWFGLNPSDIGDQTGTRYNSVAADRAAFFTTSLQPLLVKIQNELNGKIFGYGSDTYCEFLTRAIVQGDPAQEQAILNGYLTSGAMTIAEVREVLNLPYKPELDVALVPTNQAVVTGQPDASPITPVPTQAPAAPTEEGTA